MKKILINRKLVQGPWGGGNNFLKNFSEALKQEGYQLVQDLSTGDVDLIVMHDPRYDELGISVNEIAAYKRAFPKVKVLHRINECDSRKGTNEIDKLLLLSNTIADRTVFISEWLKDYFVARGFHKPSEVIYNGCDITHFYPQKKSEKENLQYPIKIVTHHWSDNWLKGFDVYRRLDEICQKYPQKYQFTYVGRYAKEYLPKATKIVSPLYEKDLGNELRMHDVYVTASRWEPCGMHHIEGAASGLPVLYHVDGGGIVEGCKKHGIKFSSLDEVEEKLECLVNNYNDLKFNIDYNFLSSTRCIGSYIKTVKEMLL